jgi:DNA-binding transcriptional MerR regulator
MEKALPSIPAKRYFTIGEVSALCGVKPYVLRYWEQEFTQLKPMKRRGNRRYYQHHEVLLVRRIRELLYDQGFTISGARNRLSDGAAAAPAPPTPAPAALAVLVSAAPTSAMAVAAAKANGPAVASMAVAPEAAVDAGHASAHAGVGDGRGLDPQRLRIELLSIRELLSV